MSSWLSIAVLATGLALSGTAVASDVGYLYGRVETVNGDAYEGELRWGKEESFWDDMFNANKYENENLDYVDPDVLDRRKMRRWDAWGMLSGHPGRDFVHVLAVRFGDLKRIDVRKGEELVAEFRNGEKMKLDGGSNDVGAEITVVDGRHGQRVIPWNRIRTIEFDDTPSRLEDKLGEPIYGTVKSGSYDFTGRIQWDNDESLTTDMLDGSTRDGKMSIPFDEIAAIKKHRQGVLVTLRSGDEHYLTGSNDVNHENRGIVVVVPKIGSVKIGWNDFDEVKFERAPGSGHGYSDFARGRDLQGTVVTRDGRYEGRIVFDLDESFDFELLQGKNGDTEYLIPFRDIARIKPKGGLRADVELRIGLTIELEDGQDVTRKNDGLLVFDGDRDPRYVAWKNVTAIEFH